MPNQVEYEGFEEFKSVTITYKIMDRLKDFSPAEFMVLAEIFYKRQNGEKINVKTILEETRLSEDEVNASLDRLIELKIITTDK